MTIMITDDIFDVAERLLRLTAGEWASQLRETRNVYSVYARTRKTEALNFSISAALSDSDFRVLA